MGDIHEGKNVALAFLIGGLIGAGIALLYAPQSGTDTRRDISRTAKRIKKRTVEAVDDAIDSVNDFVDNVKDVTADLIERGSDLSESARKELVRAYESSQKAIGKQKDRLMETLKIS